MGKAMANYFRRQHTKHQLNEFAHYLHSSLGDISDMESLSLEKK
jgi:hypothetical protein